MAEYGRKRLQNTGSEDPRLIALDSDESLSAKAGTLDQEKSHVVEIDGAENSEKDFRRGAESKNKLKQDGRRDRAYKEDDYPVKRSLFKTTKELIASGLVKKENEEQCASNVMFGDDTDNEDGKQSRDSTCDLHTCLDTLDNLKTVLQNAVVSNAWGNSSSNTLGFVVFFSSYIANFPPPGFKNNSAPWG